MFKTVESESQRIVNPQKIYKRNGELKSETS
jgi:hypothetical protein